MRQEVAPNDRTKSRQSTERKYDNRPNEIATIDRTPFTKPRHGQPLSFLSPDLGSRGLERRAFIFVKGDKKWGLRTEIEVSPPRVCLESASCLPQTRLRLVLGLNRNWGVVASSLWETRLRAVSFLSPARHTQSPPAGHRRTLPPPNRPPPAHAPYPTT